MLASPDPTELVQDIHYTEITRKKSTHESFQAGDPPRYGSPVSTSAQVARKCLIDIVGLAADDLLASDEAVERPLDDARSERLL